MQFSDDRVTEQIKAAAARRRRARERRAELQHARNRGLTARHMAKIARLQARDDTHTTDEPPDAA